MMGDVFDGDFTEVINSNGKRQTIPTSWIGTSLGEPFTVRESPTPSEEWKVADLRTYAETQGIDLTGAGSAKADILARIQGATTPNTEDPAGPGEE
jgi:hypothetical protein